MDKDQIRTIVTDVLAKEYLSKKEVLKLTGQSRLENDFGISGDDYWELLEKIGSMLNRKLSEQRYTSFFTQEGSDLIGGAFRLVFGEKVPKPIDPTVDELIEVIHADVQERKVD